MKNYMLTLFIFLMLSSCTAYKYVYSPTSANLLQVEKRGDVKMACNYAAVVDLISGLTQNQIRNGIDVQSIYAISNRSAVKLDFYRKWESNESAKNAVTNEIDKINYKKTGVEFGYGKFSLSKTSTENRLQLFGGLGFGKLDLFQNSNSQSNLIFYHSMNYSKLFLQPSFSLKLSKNYTASICTKLSAVKYFNVSTNFPSLDVEPLGYIDTKPSFFGDFIFQNEFGFNELVGLRFQTQLGFTKLFTRFPSSTITFFNVSKYDYNNAWINLGVIGDINVLFHKK